MKSFATKFRKTLAAIAGAVASLIAIPAAAQVVGPTTLGLPSTFSVTAASTNTTYTGSNWMASAVSGSKLGVAISFKLTSTGTSAVVFKFDSSLDGSKWESAAFSVTQAANGTNEVTKHGNFDVSALPYIRLSAIENPNANAITNVTIRTGHKRGI